MDKRPVVMTFAAAEPRAKAPWLLIVDRKYLFGIAAAATARV